MNTETEKERLKRIERGVLEASHMRDDEIEDLVAAPHLFRTILADVERRRTEGSVRQNNSPRPWTWRLKLAASAALVLVLGISIGVSLYSKGTQTNKVVVPTSESEQVATVDNAPNEFVPGSRTIVEDPKQKKIDQPVIQRASVRTTSRHRKPEVEEVSEFYPLTYTDGQDTNVDGSQLVRVELPRSSLMAMGVDPPAENDAPKFKTDLLIGSDGVMKAVRFVK